MNTRLRDLVDHVNLLSLALHDGLDCRRRFRNDRSVPVTPESPDPVADVTPGVRPPGAGYLAPTMTHHDWLNHKQVRQGMALPMA